MRRLLGIAAVVLATAPSTTGAAKVTVDDLMKLRSIVDVKISPDGNRVAYAVSTPSLERNAHEVAIFVVWARGVDARRIAEGTRVFNVPLPAPRLRWSPDGTSVSFLGLPTDKRSEERRVGKQCRA